MRHTGASSEYKDVNEAEWKGFGDWSCPVARRLGLEMAETCLEPHHSVLHVGKHLDPLGSNSRSHSTFRISKIMEVMP